MKNEISEMQNKIDGMNSMLDNKGEKDNVKILK